MVRLKSFALTARTIEAARYLTAVSLEKRTLKETCVKVSAIVYLVMTMNSNAPYLRTIFSVDNHQYALPNKKIAMETHALLSVQLLAVMTNIYARGEPMRGDVLNRIYAYKGGQI